MRNLSNLDWRQTLGGVAVLVGFVIVVVAWFGASGTNDVSAEFSYAISGGLGGVSAVVLGAVLLISFEHHLDRVGLQRVERRVDELEAGLAGEFDHMSGELGQLRLEMRSVLAETTAGRTNGMSERPVVARSRRPRQA